MCAAVSVWRRLWRRARCDAGGGLSAASACVWWVLVVAVDGFVVLGFVVVVPCLGLFWYLCVDVRRGPGAVSYSHLTLPTKRTA